MSAVAVVVPEPELQIERDERVSEATALAVRDQESYDVAASMMLGLVELRKKIVDHHKASKAASYAAWKAVCAAESSLLDPVAKAEQIVKDKLATYEAEQRRLLEEAERLAQEEMERAAAESLESIIEQAEASGASAAEVQAIIEQPVCLPRPVVSSVHQKAKGVIARRTYKAHIFDIKKLAAAVANGQVPVSYILPNEQALNAAARSQGAELARFVPGVQAVEVNSISVRRG